MCIRDRPYTTLAIEGNATQRQVPVARVSRDGGGWQLAISQAVRPFIVVLDQTYDPDWQMVSGDNKTQILHMDANLGVNSWLVMGSGTYSLTISYDRKRAYAITYGLAGAALLAGVLLVAWLTWGRTRAR